jgi:hypothetical protein
MVTTPAPGYFRDFRVRQPLITILLTVAACVPASMARRVRRQSEEKV